MGTQVSIMAILNATPDSFFARSRYDMSILDSGADIIDIGACSTRPGSSPVSQTEEWIRLEPVLKAVRDRKVPGLRVSIDTFWSSVAKKAFDLMGDIIVNDVSAGAADPQMLPWVASQGLEYVAMCNDNDPAAFFDRFSLKAEALGLDNWILDPGFGFGKTVEENWAVLHSLEKLNRFSRRILVGLSRKSMIYRPLGLGPDDEKTLRETCRAQIEAVRRGASILRVHDVGAARLSLRGII